MDRGLWWERLTAWLLRFWPPARRGYAKACIGQCIGGRGYQVTRSRLRRGPLGIGWWHEGSMLGPDGRTYSTVWSALTLNRLVRWYQAAYEAPPVGSNAEPSIDRGQP